jgi:hypothetical protein
MCKSDGSSQVYPRVHRCREVHGSREQPATASTKVRTRPSFKLNVQVETESQSRATELVDAAGGLSLRLYASGSHSVRLRTQVAIVVVARSGRETSLASIGTPRASRSHRRVD